MREMTELKRRDAALAASHSQGDAAQAAKGRFLATMGHELRTPLNAIIGFSEMLMKKEALMIDAERQRDYAQLINETGHHLLSLVNSILDMSKIENESFEIVPVPFAPCRAIEDCCDLLTLKARQAHLVLVCRMPNAMPDIVADRRAFNQILINLISNAIKFTDPGGTISVGAKVEEERVAVTVEDTGVGIGAEDLPRIGDRYFQARSTCDRHHDGMGLGLSIVKELLTLHGGDIEIESHVGKGTRMTFHMPIDCERARRREARVVDVVTPHPACGPLALTGCVSSESRVMLSA
jgi:two-component system, cell cycle sensor histidine kinase DivJ